MPYDICAVRSHEALTFGGAPVILRLWKSSLVRPQLSLPRLARWLE